MMEFKDVVQKDNKLLGRKEVTATMNFDKATPKYDEVKAGLASKFKVESANIAVQHVYTKFGATSAVVHARVYDSAEQLVKIEPKPKVKVAKAGEAK